MPGSTKIQCSAQDGHAGDHDGWNEETGRIVSWESESVTQALRSQTLGSKGRREIVDRAAKRASRAESNGPPPEAVESWTTGEQAEWVRSTKREFAHFLASRSEPFTTPEHFWPLVDAPREMRAMVVVVRQSLAQRLMVEVGFSRLRDTYRTRDGREFALNKIVPVYRSLVCEQEVPPSALS